MGNSLLECFYDNGVDILRDIPTNLSSIEVVDIDGNNTTIGEYIKDKSAIIFLNTANSWHLASNTYISLASMYDRYADKGFQILCFPCDQFHGEPRTEQEIKEDFISKYGFEVPLFSKIDINGENTHPVYKYLRGNYLDYQLGTEIKRVPFNFFKYLVDGDGNVLHAYNPTKNMLEVLPTIERIIEEAEYVKEKNKDQEAKIELNIVKYENPEDLQKNKEEVPEKKVPEGIKKENNKKGNIIENEI